VDARALDGRTPLMAAAGHNSAPVVAILLAAGSHAAARSTLGGRTAADEARSRHPRQPDIEAMLAAAEAAESSGRSDKKSLRDGGGNCTVS